MCSSFSESLSSFELHFAGANVTPSIWYHSVVLDIFRRFVSNERQRDIRKRFPLTTSPEAIYGASVKQLKRLVLVYTAKQESAVYSILWHAALIYIANAALKDLSDGGWRCYFLMCIRGYSRLFPSFQVAEGIAQGLLAMALSKSAITSQQARLLMDELYSNGNRSKLVEQKVGGFILDLELAVNDRKAAKVEELINKFEEITVFDEFTTETVQVLNSTPVET